VSEAARGWIEPGVAAEHPELRLWTLELERRAVRSSAGVREQLRELADGFRGPQAVAMRQQPIPWAYRVFFHQIGLDPDHDRTPVEALAVERLVKGGFRSHGLPADALTIALVETGVPIWALDADRLEGPLGLRPSDPRERFGRAEHASQIPKGRLVVADSTGPVAVLFGDLAPDLAVTRETARLALFSVQVAGVPDIHVEEALFTVVELISGSAEDG